ncbi:S-methyl-5-thioribose-1-phosphate isomerase [Amycolatopsis alkalitolerans]|uniref:Methylthioribose-1-phosphate isomerase n=1 Tax=Amycolatopsis alkalitolerans TaxID=2547244 RepID=A0A5C4LXW8_9PSEU|nr:S-methyl-5-thioribose-1-phosphate isomerase [Amycolatopsis alkalitolerans]TNC24539.1 S-methyl-5-thioribose-1-phosphate isomerase [Amycolatopsis alkalitolerans]
MRRTINWAGDAIEIIDQRALPGVYRTLRLSTIDELIDAIRTLAVRGAPALGAAGALGVALSALIHDGDENAVRADAKRIADARPTAVNLSWGVRRALAFLPDGHELVLAGAMALLDEDERVNRKASERAAEFVLDRCGRRPLRLLTHCNAGRLATVGWGTALGVVWHLRAAGHLDHVFADETRPLLQGARLTAWELAEAGVPYRLLPDSAAASAIARDLVDCVVVGADRIAANGDVANKVGTYPLALAAARHRVPFVVVAPMSTVDPEIPDGGGIVIEERPAGEVTEFAGHRVAPANAAVFNPAFDVTPAELITAIVTEEGFYPFG